MALANSDFEQIKNDTVAKLKSLSRGQLHALLAEIFDQYKVKNELTCDIENTVCLASITAEFDGDLPYVTCWSFPQSSGKLIPYESPDDAEQDDPYTGRNTGKCSRCRIVVCCSEKIAICPVCDTTVHCT